MYPTTNTYVFVGRYGEWPPQWFMAAFDLDAESPYLEDDTRVCVPDAERVVVKLTPSDGADGTDEEEEEEDWVKIVDMRRVRGPVKWLLKGVRNPVYAFFMVTYASSALPFWHSDQVPQKLRCTKASLLCNSGLTFSHHEHACVRGRLRNRGGRSCFRSTRAPLLVSGIWRGRSRMASAAASASTRRVGAIFAASIRRSLCEPLRELCSRNNDP